MCVFARFAPKTVCRRALGTAALWLTMWAAPAAAQAPPVPSRLSLADAVTLALQRNPSVREATAATEAADADRVTADRRLNPAFSLDSVGSQELTLRLDQEFETAGRRRLRTAAAESGREVAQAGLRDTRRLIELEVRRAYLATVLAETDRTVAQTALEEIDKVIALNRARLDQGEISGADLRRLQVERLRFVEDVFAADLASRNARSTLLALLNSPTLDQPLELTDGLAVPPGELAPILAAAAAGASGRNTLLTQALAARPDMQGAQKAEALAETTTRLQRALRTPNLTFGAGYQRNFGANAVVFGATAPLPFFNRNQGGVLRADAERRAAAARSALVDTGVRLDVQRTLNAVEVNRARVGYIEREYITSARESRDIVLESYRLGVANLIDYLDAQRAFRDTQRTYNRALFDQRLSLFELAAAVGFTDLPR
jgi:cobalt-zinc-cadmium efflux system outer membrane protein